MSGPCTQENFAPQCLCMKVRPCQGKAGCPNKDPIGDLARVCNKRRSWGALWCLRQEMLRGFGCCCGDQLRYARPYRLTASRQLRPDALQPTPLLAPTRRQARWLATQQQPSAALSQLSQSSPQTQTSAKDKRTAAQVPPTTPKYLRKLPHPSSPDNTKS